MSRFLEPGSNCVDVGAHRGVMLRQMIRLAPRGRHAAVEPLPAYAKGLRRRFKRLADIHELAVSDTQGEITFHQVLSYPSYSGIARRRYPSEDVTIKDIRVRTALLDDLVAGRSIDFVKIDVEGGELAVLRGAGRVLKEYRPVVLFEHGSDGTAEALARTAGVWAELQAAGLSIYKIRAWLDGGAPVSWEDFCEALGRGDYYFVAADEPLATWRISHSSRGPARG
ncbi:MAG: FkbM family methyltransferase [Actinomycetota bacterium]|nr:FkbM family methyltransferase [Actinomycetota bacterium]